MKPLRAASGPLVALALLGAGAARFGSAVGALPDGAAKAALLVLALVVLAHLVITIDPAWLLSAGIAATMFAGRWENMGIYTPVPPHRALLAAGLVALLLRVAEGERPPLRLGTVHLVLGAAVAFALVSAIAAGTVGRQSAQFVLVDDYGVLPFLMFAAAPLAFATDRQRGILLGTLVGVGAYLSITAVLEKLDLYDLVVPHYIGNPDLGTHFGRSRGPFLEAGANGLALYASAVAAAIAVVLWRGRLQRGCAAAVLVLAPVGLLLTVTRSVWLAGIGATAVALVTTPGLRRFVVPAAAAGTAAVLVAFAAIPGLAEQAQNRESDKDPVYERENTTAAGLRMVADRPLLGFGWERADDRIDPYFRLDPDIPLTGARAGFHNLYLQYAVSIGLVGLGIWLFGLALAVRSAFTGRPPPTVRPWQVGLKAILVSWTVVGLFSPSSYIFTTVLLWTWAGVASARPQPEAGAIAWSRLQGKPRSTSLA